MADSDLDKYLEDLGISMAEEEEAPAFPEAPELETPLPVAGVLSEGASPRERAENFLVNLLLNFDPAYAVEVGESEDGLRADIFGGDAGKIIGRGGRTLQALEYLTNAVLNRAEGESVRVTIDVGGYKRRRDERLREAARKAADQVRETGAPYAFKPMSAVERRVIHMELADDPSVRSESSGEGKERHVVVRIS